VGNGSSASVAGLELTREGKLKFDSGVFNAKLTADPTLVQGLFGGKLDVGTDNVAGTVDDVLTTDGIGARLQRLAQQASDSVSGTLTVLANGQDSRAKDLTKQISDWDLRLTNRQASLTKQFNAMEKALGALQNQASWLNSQLNSLPSWSSNS
jgi:flagellar hook-associated protein 2